VLTRNGRELRVRLIPLHVANQVTQGVEQALEVLDRAQGRAHERLDPGRIAIGLIFHALDLCQTFRQPVAGIRGSVETKEALDLRLERAEIIGQPFCLRYELPQQGHVLRDAPGDGNVIQGGQFQNLVRFDQNRLNRGQDRLDGRNRILAEVRHVHHGELGMDHRRA
jgi:hypothetical protein